MTAINICVCTCKRAQLLKECLESIALIDVPSGLSVSVTVIDNDAAESANAVVSSLQSSFPFVFHYYVEKKRGIPCARNRAIEVTHALNADYLVFIDDDERVKSDWLKRLYEFCVEYGGNIIVSGEVEAELPEGTPPEIRVLYQRKDRVSGQQLATCATNNVLVPVSVTRELGVRFDERNPLAGGTDTIFFCEAVAKGASIYKCVEALVYEVIPQSRTSLSWWAKRKYRAGITEAWRKKQKGRSGMVVVFVAAVRCLVDFVVAGIGGMLLRRSLRNRYYLKACKSAGVVAGVMGANVDSYQQIDGR